MFCILNYGEDDIDYNIFIRDYPLLDIGVYITPIIILNI